MRFTSLLHHIYSPNTLREAYYRLERDSAPGVDGQTWQAYGEALEENLRDLSARLKCGAHRAKPVRRVYIPKTDGRQRPLGVPVLEDKLVQRAMVEVLNAIYESHFLGFSYGFRPRHSQHHALDALYTGLVTRKVNWVLDAVERFVTERLRLRLNRDKSAVDRPCNRKFLGATVTMHRQPKLRVGLPSVKRLKAKLRPMLRCGRGRNLGRVVVSLTRMLRGWVAYYKLAEVKASFEQLDQWLRRKLRCIVWRQWKRHRTQFKELCRRGLDHEQARRSAWNGRGPWWNAGAANMNRAAPTSELRGLGLISPLEEHRRLACCS